MEGYVRALVEINEVALRHNVSVLQKKSGSARLIAVLKANAYGHGLIKIARALEGSVDGVGVACVKEAIQLREHGIKMRIVVLEGALLEEDYKLACSLSLDMVIHATYQYLWWKAHQGNGLLTIWLKVNTGMNRLGLPAVAIYPIIRELAKATNVRSIILMSHLASADYLKDPMTRSQAAVFQKLVSIPCAKLSYSLANSAALLAFPQLHYDWVRPGLSVYGVSPFMDKKEEDYNLRPVMTLRAKIIAVREVESGDTIGYYGKAYCYQKMRVGIVGFGYGDGYPYDAPEGTPVLYHQQRLSLIGQVSMDMLTIDLTQQPQARVGDEVVLWGQNLGVEEVARASGRSCYELLCGVQRNASTRLVIR